MTGLDDCVKIADSLG